MLAERQNVEVEGNRIYVQDSTLVHIYISVNRLVQIKCFPTKLRILKTQGSNVQCN